ncbi:MAG: ribosomal-processing cysteine protease Prp [Lachnospiraceae bacterium]|jgi:uncharacterized protein YsxB (DUF464 family)|nr:ribosomal-processing cysteine protease Prp [Lachnospiraceae bacterium]MCH4064591.1 ribosomal-processing cysteine protease Prp [Lachnospiraceae bacterium]MCH4104822.1 ribosomal-processing cysteine protease Prp [Lachnospiraceae bacterium]MCI1310346.1 ribosomal-processing cysteine protease Prp [Lachnospiraceae bacterium]MCI1334786.1 ribosomal-processing cysteine protease Prp [Lachnospiraceae bacterium]
MITVTIRRRKGEYTGFSSEGHAGYADEGYDIFCAAVSVLTVNTVNAIEQIAGDRVEDHSESGLVTCEFPDGLGHDGTILMEAMVQGLQSIAETSGKSYLRLRFEEV